MPRASWRTVRIGVVVDHLPLAVFAAIDVGCADVELRTETSKSETEAPGPPS